MDFLLPESIRSLLQGRHLTESQTGLSGSRVLMGDDMVLKIGPATEETENERAILAWLRGKLPVPEILAYEVRNGTAYCLMTRVRGRMLCDPVYLQDPAQLADLAAAALRQLWAVDISGYPCDQRLDRKLQAARRQVDQGLVDLDNVEPETFGPGGFRDPEDLLGWLETHRPPEEDLVLSHGDLCLPNVLAQGRDLSGFIDCGRMGAADRWQDLALCLRSLRHNAEGAYGGAVYPGVPPEVLLEKLGVAPDKEKLRYYLLLDELF